MAFKTGKLGKLSWNAVELAMDEYSFNIDGELPDVSNFKSGGGIQRLDGVTDNIIDVSGPYDTGAMAIVRGSEHVLIATLDAGVTLTATCRCKSIQVGDKYKDAGRVKVQFQASDGTNFVAGIA
jgi:hypothetical protein